MQSYRSLVNNNGQRQGGREALDGQALPRIPELPAAEHSVEDASCPLTSALSGSGQNSEHHPVLSNQDLTFSTDEVIFQSGFEIIQISTEVFQSKGTMV